MRILMLTLGWIEKLYFFFRYLYFCVSQQSQLSLEQQIVNTFSSRRSKKIILTWRIENILYKNLCNLIIESLWLAAYHLRRALDVHWGTRLNTNKQKIVVIFLFKTLEQTRKQDFFLLSNRKRAILRVIKLIILKTC